MEAFDAATMLRAFQLADSFFPTGAFGHSQGLEGMARRGWISSPADLENWLGNQLRRSVLPSDGVALFNTHRAASAGDLATVAAIDRLLHAMKLPAELRTASQQSGRRLLTETAALVAAPLLHDFHQQVRARQSPGNAAVALGVAASALEITATVALLAFCHSYAVGVLGAAMRLLRLTHTDTQGILFRASSVIAKELDIITGRDWHDMSAMTLQTDLAAMGHETDDLRMFAS